MTQEQYERQRGEWMARLMAIPRRRHFPRCVRYRLMQVARLDAAYKGTDINTEYSALAETFNAL